MYYNLNETIDILNNLRVNMSSEHKGLVNKFTTKPKGIIITDTYNNLFTPIKNIQIDTNRFDLPKVFMNFREYYAKNTINYLPWHYFIEFIDDKYYVFNTRPIDMKYPFVNNDIKSDDIFFKNNLYDISECIHICLMGDSNIDVYTHKVYEYISSFCITPYKKYANLKDSINLNIHFLNIGKKFNQNLLNKFISR